MEPIITKCGYRCDLCLAYKPNLEKHPESKQILSDGWYTYFGFRIPPEDIYCDGCLSMDGRQIDSSCPVRPCVIERGISDCAFCDEYICEKLETRIVSFKDIQERFEQPIPEADRAQFIRPYENEKRLKKIRLK